MGELVVGFFPDELKAGEFATSPDMNQNEQHGNGGGGGGGMLETRVATLEVDVGYIRRDIDELKVDVKSVSLNMVKALERLEKIDDSLSKKPSTDLVDKKISDAKLAVLLGVPAIIAIGTAIYKAAQHYF